MGSLLGQAASVKDLMATEALGRSLVESTFFAGLANHPARFDGIKTARIALTTVSDTG